MTSKVQPVSTLFHDPKWLGFDHDEQPTWSTFNEYRNTEVSVRAQSKQVEHGLPEIQYVQSWFTFGLLEAAIERKVHESELLVPSEATPGALVISSEKLPGILRKWVDCVGQLESDKSAAWMFRCNAALNQAHEQLEDIHWWFFPKAAAVLDDIPAMAINLSYVCESVTIAFQCTRPVALQGYSWGYTWDFVLSVLYGETLEAEAAAQGWCPSTLSHIRSSSSVALVSYACLRGPFDRYKHEGCSNQICLMSNVDVNNYIPKHTEVNCYCDLLNAPFDSIAAILDDGDVPVIKMASPAGLDRDEEVRISVARASETPYIAISHVWADGLGSTSEVGLPCCQVRKLGRLASRVVLDAGFWIDSLCVPRDPQRRSRAIAMMAQTYQNAKGVLVVDEGIHSLSARTSPEDKMLRIVTSGWIRRVWTLQEAVMAQKLIFVFADDFVPGQDLIPSAMDMTINPLKTALAMIIYRLGRRATSGTFRIGDVARSLSRRTTSKAEDETLAVASLLGVDAYKLAMLPPSERMKNILLMVGDLPQNILLLNGPKLAHVGFRWAPSTFMATGLPEGGGLTLATSGTQVQCTEEGLKGKYNMLLVNQTLDGGAKGWRMREDKTNIAYIVSNAIRKPGIFDCFALLCIGSFESATKLRACVAVSRSSEESGAPDGSTTWCTYQRRYVIKRQPRDEFPDTMAKMNVIPVVNCGEVEFCVT